LSTWALFPKLETQVAVAGPTPEARFAHHPPTSLTDVTEGSHCWFCGELGLGVGASVNLVLPLYTFGKYSAGKVDRVAWARHQQGSNFAFWDGHAKWMRDVEGQKIEHWWPLGP